MSGRARIGRPKEDLAAQRGPATIDEQVAEASAFLKGFFSGTANQRARRRPKAPLSAIQVAARHDPDAFARRTSLFFLDHYANDESTAVFGEALGDPVAFVRNMALHSLACESCKVDGLEPEDVVPGLITVLEGDPDPEMRTKAVPLLWRLSDADPRARAALERIAAGDDDTILQHAAVDALAGRFVAPRKRYEGVQRTHAKTARRLGAKAG